MISCIVKNRFIALKHQNCVSLMKIAYLDNTLYYFVFKRMNVSERVERERERERIDKE